MLQVPGESWLNTSALLGRSLAAFTLALLASLNVCNLASQNKVKRPAIADRLAVVRPAGFEPATPWFEAKYSDPLSYGRSSKRTAKPRFALSGKSFGLCQCFSSQNSIESRTAPWIGILVRTGEL